MNQFVYVMEDQNTQLLKIGISIDPEFRAKCVNADFGCNAVVIGVLEVQNAVKTEQFIHGMLESCRVVGEWFEVPSRQKEYLLAYFSEKKTSNQKRSPKSAQASSLPSSGSSKIVWKLKKLLEANNISVYRLEKECPSVSRTSLYKLAAGETDGIRFPTLNALLGALNTLTSKEYSVCDLLEFTPDA
jgi:DNA-binding Xre family transcriptional regulator